MASFNGNIDLLALKGAKVLKGIDEKSPEMGYVCIPVAINEIKVEASRQDAQKMQAKLRVNIWPFSEAYKDAIRRKASERGDDPNRVSVPTHEMQISYSADFVKAWAPKIAPSVIEQNKERHPEYAQQLPTDENSGLFKAIRSRMNYRLANLYQTQSQQVQQNTATPQYGMASGATAYVPPVTPEDPFAAPWEDSDVPF